MPDTPITDSRKLYDPGPLPTEPLRQFAPVMCGDIQTSKAYLENALIRMGSVASQGERFTPFEARSLEASLRDISEAHGLLCDALKAHRDSYAEHDRTDSR